MSNALAIREQAVSRYDDAEMVKALKDTVCRGASDSQFKMFIEICKGTGLNPFLKEIWFVPNVGVIAARDGYLRVANENPNFDGMETRVEREKDGTPIKAVCSVWRKDRSHPVTCEAYYSEYKKPGNVWQTYKSAMISKVAEVLALKRSFSINGVVSEEEIGFDETPAEPSKSRAEKVADAQAVAAAKIVEMQKAIAPTVHEAEFVDNTPPADEPPPAAKDAWIKPMMDSFALMKDLIGEPAYREVLKGFECKDKRDLMRLGRATATAAYKQMAAIDKRNKTRAEFLRQFAELATKMGEKRFATSLGQHGYESADEIPQEQIGRILQEVETDFSMGI